MSEQQTALWLAVPSWDLGTCTRESTLLILRVLITRPGGRQPRIFSLLLISGRRFLEKRLKPCIFDERYRAIPDIYHAFQEIRN